MLIGSGAFSASGSSVPSTGRSSSGNSLHLYSQPSEKWVPVVEPARSKLVLAEPAVLTHATPLGRQDSRASREHELLLAIDRSPVRPITKPTARTIVTGSGEPISSRRNAYSLVLPLSIVLSILPWYIRCAWSTRIMLSCNFILLLSSPKNSEPSTCAEAIGSACSVIVLRRSSQFQVRRSRASSTL